MKPLSLCFRSSTLRPQTYMTGRTCHAASTAYMHSGLCLVLWVWFDSKDPALAALQFRLLLRLFFFLKALKPGALSIWRDFWKRLQRWVCDTEVSSGTEYVLICFDCTLRCKGCWCLQSQQSRRCHCSELCNYPPKENTHMHCHRNVLYCKHWSVWFVQLVLWAAVQQLVNLHGYCGGRCVKAALKHLLRLRHGASENCHPKSFFFILLCCCSTSQQN